MVCLPGDGLVYWDLMVTLRSLMPTVEATNALISGFDFTAVPIFGGSGLRYPPPVPPPGLPPLAPARQRANGTETRDSNLTQEETSNIGTHELVETARAAGHSSAARPPLPARRARAAALVLGSGPGRAKAHLPPPSPPEAIPVLRIRASIRSQAPPCS